MHYNNIIDTKYWDRNQVPNDHTLRLDFNSRFHLSNEEEVKIMYNGLHRTIYLERGENIVKIDRLRKNCFAITDKESINCYGRYDKSNPFCKMTLEPFKNSQSISIVNIADWNSLINSIQNDTTSDYSNFNINNLKTIYSKYIIEDIIEFCDKFKVVETCFTITDLFPHETVKHPSAYGFHTRMNLKKQFINGMFNSITE